MCAWLLVWWAYGCIVWCDVLVCGVGVVCVCMCELHAVMRVCGALAGWLIDWLAVNAVVCWRVHVCMFVCACRVVCDCAVLCVVERLVGWLMIA